MNKIVLLILLLSFSLVVISQEKTLDNPESFLKEIAKISKETSSIKADFTQEKSVSYLKETIISSGHFYSQNGDMRWEQNKPFSYIMLLSEEGVKIKDDGKEQNYGAMANKFMSQIRNILLSSINGSFTENKEFTPSYFETENFVIVKLKPTNRRLAKMFEGVHLKFDKKNYRLKTLTFVQEDGKSTMTFFNEVFNTSLSSELFTKFK